MIVLLDTCGLLWYTQDPSSLSGAAHKSIANADKVVVSSISFWEIGVKVNKKKLDLGMELEKFVSLAELISDVEIFPVDHNLWIESVQLDWNHKDPADRVIVALAKQLKAKIVTDDEIIKKYYPKTLS